MYATLANPASSSSSETLIVTVQELVNMPLVSWQTDKNLRIFIHGKCIKSAFFSVCICVSPSVVDPWACVMSPLKPHTLSLLFKGHPLGSLALPLSSFQTCYHSFQSFVPFFSLTLYQSFTPQSHHNWITFTSVE